MISRVASNLLTAAPKKIFFSTTKTMAAIQTNGAKSSPKITLYTNHGCPYAQRAHITLKELNLPYEEVYIDLGKPREPWYLEEINPRGLVPSIKYSDDVYKDEIITESSIVAHFLADTKPSTLLPQPDSQKELRAALFRARLTFFTDTWDNKIAKFLWPTLGKQSEEEKAALAAEWLVAMDKEIEPLLADAAPFFGGSKELTMAEVHTGPFVQRYYALARAGELPSSFAEGLDKLPNFSRWAKAVQAHPSVQDIWDEKLVIGMIQNKLRMNREKEAAASK